MAASVDEGPWMRGFARETAIVAGNRTRPPVPVDGTRNDVPSKLSPIFKCVQVSIVVRCSFCQCFSIPEVCDDTSW